MRSGKVYGKEEVKLRNSSVRRKDKSATPTLVSTLRSALVKHDSIRLLSDVLHATRVHFLRAASESARLRTLSHLSTLC